MGLSYHWSLPWGFFLGPRVHILFQQHESKGRHFFLNLLFFVPLLFHHFLQLEASQLHAPLALVVQDVRIRSLHQGSLQVPQFLLSLVVRPLTTAAPHQGQVSLNVAVGAVGVGSPIPLYMALCPGGTTAPAAAASGRRLSNREVPPQLLLKFSYPSEPEAAASSVRPPQPPPPPPPRFLRGRSGLRLRHSHPAWAALRVSTT